MAVTLMLRNRSDLRVCRDVGARTDENGSDNRTSIGGQSRFVIKTSKLDDFSERKQHGAGERRELDRLAEENADQFRILAAEFDTWTTGALLTTNWSNRRKKGWVLATLTYEAASILQPYA